MLHATSFWVFSTKHLIWYCYEMYQYARSRKGKNITTQNNENGRKLRFESSSSLINNIRKWTYLKPGHLILKVLLSSHNWNTAMFNTIANVFLLSSPIKAIICTFEVCLLQKMVTQPISEITSHTSAQKTKVTHSCNWRSHFLQNHGFSAWFCKISIQKIYLHFI